MAGEIKNGEGRGGLPRFCSERLRARRKKLETQADSKLQRPRVVALRADHAPGAEVSRIQSRIKEHRVVEQIGGDELELEASALVDPNVLRHSHVHVPIREAAENANTAGASIQTQNRIASCGRHGSGIREDVEIPGVIVDRVATCVFLRENTLFVVKEVGAITRTERLGVRIGVAVEWRTAADSKDRGDCPPAKDVANKAMLAFEDRRIVQCEDVVHKRTVEVLQPVHIVQVEYIVERVLAGGLDKSASTQGLAVGKILLQGQTTPVVDLEGDEASVVVSMADAGVVAHTAGELPIPAESRGIDRAVQHTTLEVETRYGGLLALKHDRAVSICAGRRSANGPAADAALVQSRPQTPHVLVLEVAKLLVHHSSSTVCKTGAVACRPKRGLKERLCGNNRAGLCSVVASIVGCGAAHSCFDFCVCIRECLAIQRHHVGDGVDVDGLIFVSDSPTNVAHFQDKFVAQLPLDGEVERIHDIGTEMRIESFASGRRDVINSREGWLG